MNRALIIAALGILGGCNTSSEAIPGPSGATIHQAKCSGSSSACLRDAAKTCGGSYQVLDSSSNAGGLVADVLPGPVTWFKMAYQCGASDGKLPTFPFSGPQYRVPASTVTTCNAIGTTVSCRSY